MNVRFGGALAAAVIALAAQSAIAQPMNGCPDGHAMQSSSPSGKDVTCVAINESSIVGRWAVTGTTNCLQSSRGFDASMSPLVTPGSPTIVSQLTANSTGTRTFHAGGTGTSSGETQSLSYPATVFGGPPPVFGGGASIAGLGGSFTWSIKPDGTLFIQDTNPIVQPFLAPPSRAGFSATIVDLPPYVGHISKDRRTITLAHPGMAVETSELRDGAGLLQSRTPRVCWRQRFLTRLPD